MFIKRAFIRIKPLVNLIKPFTGGFFLLSFILVGLRILIFFSFSIVKLAMVIFPLISCIIHFPFFRIRLISSSCQIWEICFCSRLIFPSNVVLSQSSVYLSHFLCHVSLSRLSQQSRWHSYIPTGSVLAQLRDLLI